MAHRYSLAVLAASALTILGCGGDSGGGSQAAKLERYYQGQLITSASRREEFKVAALGKRMVGAREPDNTGTAEAISFDFTVTLQDGNHLYGEGVVQFDYADGLYDAQPATIEGTADETGADAIISALNADGNPVEYRLVVNAMPEIETEKSSFAGNYIDAGGDDITATASNNGDIDINVMESCDLAGHAHNPTGHTEVQGYTLDSATGDCTAEAGHDGILIPTPENGGFYLIYSDGKKNNPITYFTLEPGTASND